jgi:hypothetical protein
MDVGGRHSKVAGTEGFNIRSMAASPKRTVAIEAELLKRARLVARERGVAVPQLVREALEHEMGAEAPQPPFSLIGAFAAGRSDLSELAGRDVYEPPPFR